MTKHSTKRSALANCISQAASRKSKRASWKLKLAIILMVSSASMPTNPAKAQERSALRYTATVRAIEAAEPAVVNIEGNKPSKAGGKGVESNVNGMGAGVIIDARGYILTNQHVVQDVKRIDVTTHDGTQYVGKLIARDSKTDLAVIKIDSSRPLPVIPCGTSSDLMRGERVVAIGNPFGYHDSVTEGIVSALHRDIPVNGTQEYPDLIQTDASINPGNSGGPLLNAEGQMIGINAAVRIGAQGIGFAIPVDRAVEVAAMMIADYNQRGGKVLEVQTDYRHGKSQLRVVRSSVIEIRSGDLVRKIGDREIKNRLNYELAMLDSNSRELPIAVERDGQRLAINISTGSRNYLTGTTNATSINHSSEGKSSGADQKIAAIDAGIEERLLREFGLKLEPADPAAVRSVDEPYRGGMLVVSVKNASPAAKASIQRGDILVGLLGWQTTSWDDLEYILKTPEMSNSSSPEFRIIRRSKVYFSNLELGASKLR